MTFILEISHHVQIIGFVRICVRRVNSDTNDAYSKFAAIQDPLIIFNMEKLGKVNSVQLTKDDLDAAFKYSNSKILIRIEKIQAPSLIVYWLVFNFLLNIEGNHVFI